jgi:hypothetical protein
MLRRVGNILSIAALSVVAIATPAVAGIQPAGGQPRPSGSAGITGRVVAADNGAPVRRATVSLSGLPDSQRNAGPSRVYVSRSIETDVNGRFEFTDLPAGSYTINVFAVSGFVRLVRSKEATLAERRAADITIRLERTGAIEGRIADENGDGMLGAQVQAVRRVNVGGHITLAPAGAAATTDDRGRFRLFDLPAGEYYVVATYMRSQRTHSHEVDSAPQSGYANTYYPGATALRDARAVVVRAGRGSDRVDFALTPCRLARLSIHPVDSRGVPLGRDAQLTLTRRDDFHLASSSRFTSRREDGTFMFVGVPPADYHLVITTSARMEEAAYINVTIDEEDVSLNVQTNTGARVSGRITVDGRSAGDDPSSEVPSVWVSATPPLGKYGPAYARVPLARVQGTDRFELAGLRGPMALFAEVAGGALLSIRRAGDEIAGKALEFAGTETIDDIVVALTTKVAQVDVTVTGTSAGGEPQPVLVILFSEDPALWHPGHLQYTRAMTSRVSKRPRDTVGGPGPLPPAETRLSRMVPGRYLITAIHDLDLSYPTDVRVLERLRPLAVPITLVAGQTAKVSLGVAKVAR